LPEADRRFIDAFRGQQQLLLTKRGAGEPHVLIDQTAQREANNCNGNAILLKMIVGIGIDKTSSANGTRISLRSRKPQK
jgi:hypothetical protein